MFYLLTKSSTNGQDVKEDIDATGAELPPSTTTGERGTRPHHSLLCPPSMWDWLFSQHIPDAAWVIVAFTDGSKVAGFFGADATRKGYAPTSPRKQGLHLPEQWTLDRAGWVVAAVATGDGRVVTEASLQRPRLPVAANNRPCLDAAPRCDLIADQCDSGSKRFG